MAEIDYPSVLPSPEINGYVYRNNNSFVRTETDSGAIIQRLDFKDTLTNYSVSFFLEQGALSYFEQWYKDDLNYGISYFNIDLKVGAGLESHEARFTEPYDVNLVDGKYWRVSSTLEASKVIQDALTDDQLELIEELGGFQKASDYLDLVFQTVNEDGKKLVEFV